MGSEIEARQRKIGKNHVAILPAEFREGQTVTVARLDTHTVLVSMDVPERVHALAKRLTQREPSPWGVLTARISGHPHRSDRTPRRRSGAVEPDAPVSDEEATAFALTPPTNALRRPGPART